jgi:hypothetical protein
MNTLCEKNAELDNVKECGTENGDCIYLRPAIIDADYIAPNDVNGSGRGRT